MNLRDEIAEIVWDIGRSGGGSNAADAILAKLRPAPLVWQEPCSENNWIYQAHADLGTYGIHICGGRHRAWLEAHVKPYERWLGDDDVGSVCEAKAAAETHHIAAWRKAGGLDT